MGYWDADETGRRTWVEEGPPIFWGLPSAPEPVTYWNQVKSGQVPQPATEEDFNKLFSWSDRQFSPGEFSLYSPEYQAWARANPLAFIQDAEAHRNPANQDLGSLGAEGGYSIPGAITVSNGTPNYSGAGYMNINDEGLFDGIAPMLALGALAFGIPGTEFSGLFGGGAASAAGGSGLSLGGSGLGLSATGGGLGLSPALASAGFGEGLAGLGALGAGAIGSTGGGNMGMLDLFSGLGDTTADLLSDPSGFGNLFGTGSSAAFDPGNSSFLEGLFNQATKNPLGTAGKLLTQLTGTNSQGQPNWLAMGLQGLGSYLTGNSAQNAAQTAANAQLEAARIAADAAKFRPVGVTTRFGTSNFVKDTNGNVTQAGYTISPELKALQDQLMQTASGNIGQFANSRTTTEPMGQAAQTMFGLGNSYLATTPQQQAAKYMQDQMALIQPTRDRELAALENKLRARGMLGLATGGTDTMSAANPALESFYNAQRMQDLQLAANATQGGMDYAKFGAGMVGSGGDMLKNMYGTQTASYAPFQTALGGSQNIEGLGQNALTLGVDMGKTMSNAASGGLLAQGMNNAAATMQPANAYSPWGAMLTGAGNSLAQMNRPQYDPNTGRQIQWGQ